MSEIWAWRRSSFSGGQGNCIEVASNVAGCVAMRDSKNPDGAVLSFPQAEWAAFVESVKGSQISV